MKLSSIRSATTGGFVYTPPASTYGVVRVLVIAGTVSPDVLANVLRGFWRFTPLTRVLVVENEALAPTMMNENMRSVDLSVLPMRPYDSRLPEVKKKVFASSLLAEVDACITLNTLDTASDTSPSLDVLRSLTPNKADPRVAYACIGDLFAGALVVAGDKVVWGDDLLGVDETAYRAIQQPPSPHLAEISARLRTLEA